MTSTIEYLALGTVAVVLLVAVFQAVQLSGLNEKITQQNTVLTSLVVGGADTPSAGIAGNVQGAGQKQATPPSQQMVGGC